MIEVEVACSGVVDRAEAEDGPSAIVAARTLYDEHRLAGWTLPINVVYRRDGVIVVATFGRRP